MQNKVLEGRVGEKVSYHAIKIRINFMQNMQKNKYFFLSFFFLLLSSL